MGSERVQFKRKPWDHEADHVPDRMVTLEEANDEDDDMKNRDHEDNKDQDQGKKRGRGGRSRSGSSRSKSRSRRRSRSRSPRSRSRSYSPRGGGRGGGGRGDDRGGRDWNFDDQSSDDGYRLHVADLDSQASKRDLEKLFGKYGPLKEIWMARSVPCFAFVVYRY